MEIFYSWILPPLAAFLISLFTSTAGVSGAFLLLPFQILVLGNTSPSASATNQFFNIVASPGGLVRYYREGRLFWPLAQLFLVATIPGLLAGAYIRLNYLSEIGNFKIFAAFLLLFLAWRMLADILHRGKKQKAPGSAKPEILSRSSRAVCFRYNGEEYSYRVLPLFGVTVLIGLAGGIYGIGGGSMLAPFLVSVCRLPVHVTAGATLFCTFSSSIAGVAAYSLLAPFYPDMQVMPDFALGLLLGVGGLLGMSLGARLQKYLPPLPIKIVLCAITAGTAAMWLLK